MTAPPGLEPTTQNGITGTRLNAETKRQLAGRAINALKSYGLPAEGWRIRWLMNAIEARGEFDEVTDEDVTRALMSAPWFRNRAVRHHEWAVTSS